MKLTKRILSLTVALCIVASSFISLTFAQTKSQDVPMANANPTEVIKNLITENNTALQKWESIDLTDSVWKGQYYNEQEGKYVDFPKSYIGSWDPPTPHYYNLGIGGNEPCISIQYSGKTSDSPQAERIYMTPNIFGSGYHKIALTYVAPESGNYVIGTQKDFNAVMLIFKNTNPQYYTEYGNQEDKYSFAIYKNDEKIFPADDEPYAYLTYDKLIMEIEEIRLELKKGDEIRYVTDGSTSPSAAAWVKGIVIHPWIYMDTPPKTYDDQLLTTVGFSTAETAFKYLDETGRDVTFNIVDQPTQGSVEIVDPLRGKYVYTANKDAIPNTSDSFTFTVSNGNHTSEKATVTIKLVANQAAYPKNTVFSTYKDLAITDANLGVVDPDPTEKEDVVVATYDSLQYLLNKAWTADSTPTWSGNTWDSGVDYTKGGEWTVEYTLDRTDRTWKEMEYLAQWDSGGSFTNYTGGKDVAYYSRRSIDGDQPLFFAIESPATGSDALKTNDPTKPIGRFYLTTANDGSKGDPQGSLVFTVPEDGTYVLKGNPDADKIGYPDRENLLKGEINSAAYKMIFRIEQNGTVISDSVVTFNKDDLQADFPEVTIDAKKGDKIRFVADTCDIWGGWKGQMTMSPYIERIEKAKEDDKVYDSFSYLLNKAWAADTTPTWSGNTMDSGVDYTKGGEWTVEYNLDKTDRTWKEMELLAQWDSGGSFTKYPGGNDVVYYAAKSTVETGSPIYYSIEMPGNAWGVSGTPDKTKPEGRFKLTTAADGSKGDPQGSLVFTIPEDGTYVLRGNPDAKKVGYPNREGLTNGETGYNQNIKSTFYIEQNGVEISGSRLNFNRGSGENLNADFPEIVIEAKKGDKIRFVADVLDCWAGWQGQMTMSPIVVKQAEDAGVKCTVTETTQNGTLELNEIGTFNYTPNAGFAGVDTFKINVDDGIDVASYTITINVLEDNKPVCDKKYAATGIGGSREITLTGSDDHTEKLTFKLVEGPKNGTAVLEGDKIKYTANTNYKGFDTIKVSCNDGRYESDVVEVNVLMTDVSYDAVSQIINMIQAVEECIEGDKNASLLPTATSEPWRAQYYYLGISGNINAEAGRLTYETAIAGYWLKDGDWEGFAINDDNKLPGISVEGVNYLGNTKAVFLNSGYKPNSENPVAALSFYAPEDGTYLLLPDDSMPYFTPNLSSKPNLQRPIEFWIEKDGKQIWPENGEPMKVGADDKDNLMPSILVSMKEGSKVRFCARSFADDNGDALHCIVKPVAYMAGEYQAALDPQPEGEPEFSQNGGGNNDNVGGDIEDEEEENSEEDKKDETPSIGDNNEPVNGVYPKFTLEALKRQITVAQNGIVSIKVLDPNFLTDEMIKLLNDSSLGLHLEICDEQGNAQLIWELADLTNQAQMPLTTENTSKYQDQLDKLFDSYKMQVVSLKNDVKIEGGATITVVNTGGFETGKKLYLYRLNRKNGALELCDSKVMLSSDGGYLRFEVDSSSEYIVSDMSNKKITNIDVDGGLPVWAIVLIAVGAVVLVAAATGVIVIIIVKKKKSNK